MSVAQLGLVGDLKGKSGLGLNAGTYWDANGVLQQLTAGTAGHVFTTQGTGSAPTFAAASGGGGSGGGSMIGSAAFSATGGTISGLAIAGVVSTVTRIGAGHYS